MAPSMAPTVLQTHPARPLTVSCCVQPRKKKKEKQKRVARCARSVSTKVDTYQQPRVPITAVANSRVNLSKAGYCGFAGCERHGCRDQAPMDGFTASPHTHSAPPSHGMRAVAVAVAVALAVASAGAGLQALQNTPYPAITASISSALRARPSVSTR